MQYKIGDIANIIGAERHGSTDALVNWLLIDSRSLCFPEETLFFALKTKRNDGLKYINELYNRGVRNFVVNHIPEEARRMQDCNILVVRDTLEALQRLAAYHRAKFDMPVVAITGSNGKTTVKEWLYQLLSPDFNICRSPRSYNSQVGVPLSVWLINPHNDIAIIEAGISQPDEMRSLERIIKPTIGVITNIGAAHQEDFHTLETKCAEKMLLFKDCRQVVVNMDNHVIRRSAPLIPKTAKALTWRSDEVDSTLKIRSIEKEGDSTVVKFMIAGELGQYSIPFIDDAAIENSITCFATCMALRPRVDMHAIAQRMKHLEPVAMRLEVKDGRNGCTLINDSYNSDIHSLDIALDFMSRRPDTREQKRTLILSDILQSGDSPRSLYSRVASLAESRGIQKIIGVGEEIASCADYFPMERYFFRTTEDFIDSDIFRKLSDEFVLIKGARNFHFDHITELLTKKVHQTILEVNLNALVENLNYYRSFLKPETKMVCMVKAAAYGVGSLEVSKTLQDQKVDYLAVATADEGVELRKAGITANIMIMNPEMTSFKALFDFRLEPEVFSFQILDALIREAEKEGVTNYPIHIKLDTGMHRLGFDPRKDMDRLTEKLRRQTALVPCSVFSHFVGSDGDDFDDFSHRQFDIFDEASSTLQSFYSHKIIRHICNSAAIEKFPQYHLDMVRLGLGLYGINPRTNRVLSNIATLKTTILQIRDVRAGDSIGYSRRSFVERDSRIAAIPIGYADGLNRHLGNRRGYCLVNGKKAPYIGNICMDVCMIDVTGIDCKEGDQVVIFGDDLPVTVLSDALDTLPYEILTSVSDRVQRIYIQQ